MKYTPYVVLIAFVSVFFFPIVLFFPFLCAHTTIFSFVPYLILFSILLLYIYVWSTLISCIFKKRLLKKKTQLCILIPFLACVITVVGSYGYQAWINRFEVMETEVDLMEYVPFKSEKIATLNEPVSYKMTDDLLRLDGATALYPVYASFVQAVYPEGEYPVYSEESIVQCSTTPYAYERLLNDETDVIFALAPSKQQEEMFEAENKELVMVPIGLESFVFFVNAENPVTDLTTEQIQGIYSGEIKNWKEAGGNNQSIRAFQRPEGSGSQSALIRFMKDKKIMKPIKKDVASGMGGIINQTAEYENRENAIGYSFRFYTQGMMKNNGIHLLKIDGVEPSVENIKNKTYPITNSLYAVYVKGNDNKNLQPFLEWIQSEQGIELINKTGYVGGNEESGV